jgi:hypothetical protein
MKKKNRTLRTVFTGGCSSGKSQTLAHITQKRTHLVGVPETATVLLAGGYPAPRNDSFVEIKIFQSIILNLNESLDRIFTLQNPKAKGLIFDRATLDGAAYWPKGNRDYLKTFSIDLENEYEKFHVVLFFEMPSKIHFEGITPTRFHNYQQSKQIAERQFSIWKNHPGFIKIPSFPNFKDKKSHVLKIIDSLL